MQRREGEREGGGMVIERRWCFGYMLSRGGQLSTTRASDYALECISDKGLFTSIERAHEQRDTEKPSCAHMETRWCSKYTQQVW